jgi:hypothetical protein
MTTNRTPTRINPEGSWLSSWLLLPSHPPKPPRSSFAVLQPATGPRSAWLPEPPKKLIQGVLVVIVVIALQATKVFLGRAWASIEARPSLAGHAVIANVVELTIAPHRQPKGLWATWRRQACTGSLGSCRAPACRWAGRGPSACSGSLVAARQTLRGLRFDGRSKRSRASVVLLDTGVIAGRTAPGWPQGSVQAPRSPPRRGLNLVASPGSAIAAVASRPQAPKSRNW